MERGGRDLTVRGHRKERREEETGGREVKEGGREKEREEDRKEGRTKGKKKEV